MEIQVFADGENEPYGKEAIVDSWLNIWATVYQGPTLTFLEPINLKKNANSTISAYLPYISSIRNPDIFFFETSTSTEIGGVEITTHSPDGSNIEKRYPYIWASRKKCCNAFIATPYQKKRPSGQINRLPRRHSFNNLRLLGEWHVDRDDNSLCQIVPISELSVGELLPSSIERLQLSFTDLGEFFAHYLALKTLPHRHDDAIANLRAIKTRLLKLVRACLKATTHTEASTLIKMADKWIQCYNARPESGHWERGEGQFDSIDGRLMFTLDEASFLSLSEQPKLFEFWLPQMVSVHPWIHEQRNRCFGSKRLHNILVSLQPYITTRFADDLGDAEWNILRANPSLLLERLDWRPDVYKVADLVDEAQRAAVARKGLKNTGSSIIEKIEQLLNDDTLYFIHSDLIYAA